MDELHAACHGRAEADAVVRAVDVIIHRLGDGDDGEAFAMQAFAKAERIVTADGDQAIDAQEFQVAQHMWGEVEDALFVGRGRILRVAQKVRHILGLDFGRVGAAGMEEGTTGAIDGTHPVDVELDEAVIVGCRVSRVELEQTAPTAANAHHFVAFVNCAINHGFDARVQSRYVTATCQNTDFHALLL